MVRFVFARLIWDHQVEALAHFRMPGCRWFDLHIGPEPGAPMGRKGRVLAAAWQQLHEPQTAGMLLLDGDVAIDPLDMAAMQAAIGGDPLAVHVAPVRLWPQSTQQPDWSWAHWDEGQGLSQEWSSTPDRWSFNFTYVPAKVLNTAITEGIAAGPRKRLKMPEWTFPTVDMKLNQVAQECGVKAKVVEDCHPKHMHY
jgi:hypothetical protein